MRLHLFYASTFVLCLSLFILSQENTRYSSIDTFEVTAGISTSIIGLTLLGKRTILVILRAVWDFLRNLPLPSWMTIGVSIIIILACAGIATVCEIIGYKHMSNDWIEIPLRAGGVSICCLIAAYIIISKTCKAIDQKLA